MRLRSIEQKIFLLILPICIVPPVVFLLLLNIASRLTFEETIGTELSQRAGYLAERFDRFLLAHADELRRLIQSGGGDMARLTERARARGDVDVLVRMGRDLPFTTLAMTDDRETSRIVQALTRNPFYHLRTNLVAGLPLPAEKAFFTGFALSLPGRTTPLPLAIFVFGEGSGDRRLLLISRASTLVKQFIQQQPPVHENFLIYSQAGYVVYPDQALDPATVEQIGKIMTSHYYTGGCFPIREKKDSYLLAPAASQFTKHRDRLNVPMANETWHLMLQLDRNTFMGPLDRYFWLTIVLALALTLGMLAVGWVAARQIIQPLTALRHQAEQLARGNLDVHASVASHDEIGALAASFNTMAARLRATYQALQERVEENELRARHIHVINEITGAIVQVLSLDSIFEILSRELGKLLNYDAMWIALFEQNGQDLKVTHITPLGLISLFDRGRIPLGGSLHGHVIESREVAHAEIGPHHRTEFFETRIFNAEGFQSFLIAPLPMRNQIIGTLTLASCAPEAFSARLAPMITSLAGAVAIAIEQADLFQRISHFAAELEHKIGERSRELELVNQKLLQSEKYFATGRLAGNLAHEINNPLAIIKNYLQLVKNNLGAAQGGRRKTDPMLSQIQVMEEEVGRIARMVRQMLDLHRPPEQTVQTVDINALTGEILDLMGESLEKAGIRIVRDLAAGLPPLIVSPDLLRQVLINLIRNAQDAMEGRGGRLTIRTSLITGWENGAETQVVRIRISDTGCGIAPEHLSQIFDPFFTTKPPDKGTGLGLCVSYSIVSMYGGTIEADSEPDRGTHMTVTLPVEPSTEEPSSPVFINPEEEPQADD